MRLERLLSLCFALAISAHGPRCPLFSYIHYEGI
jgi:hypothetical protein